MKPGLCPFCRTRLRPKPYTQMTKCTGCGYKLPTASCYVPDLKGKK